MKGETIVIKTDYENCHIVMFDRHVSVNTKWQHIQLFGVIITIIGLLIVINSNSNSLDNILNKLGFMFAMAGCVIILAYHLLGVGTKEVPAYELFSGFGSKVIIKTTPEQDKIAVCIAKKELEDIIKEEKTKSLTKREQMHEMVKCQKGV